MNLISNGLVRRMSLVLMLAIILVLAIAPMVSYAGGVDDIDIQMTSNGGIQISDSSGDWDFSNDKAESGWQKLYMKIKGIIVGIGGVLTLVLIGALIVNITKLGASSGNEQARSKAIMGIALSLVGAAMMGSATLFFGFFYNAL